MDGVDASAPLNFEIDRDADGTTVVTVGGDLDIATTEELNAAVTPVIQDGPARLIVDVSALRFADSSAIALWVRWAAQVNELQLRGASPLLHRLISSMGLANHLRLTS